MAGFRIKGIVDDTDTCECCGTRLKRAVALMPLDADGNEDGDAVYYGTSCAAKALRWSTTRVTNTARAAQARWESDAERAREWLAAYEPVEFGSTREKFNVFVLERHNKLRQGESVSRAVADLLAHARAILAAKP